MYGLIIGGFILSMAVVLLIDSKIGTGPFIALTIVAIVSGVLIAGSGPLKKIYANLLKGELSIEHFEEQADAIKKKTLDEIKAEVAEQKKQMSDMMIEANKTREELERVAEMAAPPLLSLESKEIKQVKGGYHAVFIFRPSKNRPFGMLAFYLEVLEGSEATIKNLDTGGGSLTVGEDKISPDGKKATTEYWPHEVMPQTVKVTLSGKCRIRISCNYMKEPLELEIK